MRKDNKIFLNTLVDSEEAQAARTEAARRQITRSELIRQALRQFITQTEAARPPANGK